MLIEIYFMSNSGIMILQDELKECKKMKQQVDVAFLSTNDVFQRIVRNALTSQLEQGIKRAEQNVDNSAIKTVFFTHNYDEEFSSIVRQVKETFDVIGLNADEDK